jgi:hypothetical protein
MSWCHLDHETAFFFSSLPFIFSLYLLQGIFLISVLFVKSKGDQEFTHSFELYFFNG